MLARRSHDPVDQLLGTGAEILVQNLHDALATELCACLVFVFENSIGNEAQDIAGIEQRLFGWIQVRMAHVAKRKSRRRMPLVLTHFGLVMHDWALTARVEANRMGLSVEEPEKPGHETIVGEVVAELVVDMHERV